MKKYNGHRNYNAWNIALWLNNDENLYRLVQSALKTYRTKNKACEYLIRCLNGEKTPDGVRYTKTNIRLSLTD
jgi:hypothetical protein